MGRGRPKNTTKKRLILLNYRSWVVYYDEKNYVLKKKGKQKNIAYHSTLEDALQDLYDQMLLDYVNRKNNYGAKFLDLKNAILAVKNEISDLLNVSDVLKNSYMGVEKQNKNG